MAVNFVVQFEESKQSFTAHFKESSQGFNAHFEESNQGFAAHFGEVLQVEGPPYEGGYTVTPKTVSQTMETANKRMTADVTVEAIPYYAVSNTQGGETIIIGGN